MKFIRWSNHNHPPCFWGGNFPAPELETLMLITLQYLEDSPELLSLSASQVGEKLKFAFEALPVTHLLIGWNLPARIFEVCQKEAQHAGVKFFRWHPLLTGDSDFYPQPEWQTIGLNGDKVAGFQNMPEFTFVCPNHPEASGNVLAHLKDIVDKEQYQGVFLDRIRFPSPASAPLEHLGCFCEYCQRAALEVGIDLPALQKKLVKATETSNGKIELIQALLSENTTEQDPDWVLPFKQWLAFREDSITRLVKQASAVIRSSNVEIGLDCFSPGLTRMVGQNLSALSATADWIKIMCYAHTLGPAGLPFEILGLFDFLINDCGQNQLEAVKLLSSAFKFLLPSSRKQLLTAGLSTSALVSEIERGMDLATIPVLVGLEVVDISGVAVLDNQQIIQDHRAARSAGAQGVSLSWDLWHIPNDRLNLISPIWS